MTARKYTQARRNALRWPQVSGSMRHVQEPRHGVLGAEPLNWAFNFRGEALKDVAPGGGYRLHLIVDASASFASQWEWRGSVLAGESKQPLMEALSFRHMTRNGRKGAERLLRETLSEVGVPASAVWDDGAGRAGMGEGASPMHLTCRKALTPDERQQVARRVGALRSKWRRVRLRESAAGRAWARVKQWADAQRTYWRSETVKAGRILKGMVG